MRLALTNRNSAHMKPTEAWKTRAALGMHLLLQTIMRPKYKLAYCKIGGHREENQSIPADSPVPTANRVSEAMLGHPVTSRPTS